VRDRLPTSLNEIARARTTTSTTSPVQCHRDAPDHFKPWYAEPTGSRSQSGRLPDAVGPLPRKIEQRDPNDHLTNPRRRTCHQPSRYQLPNPQSGRPSIRARSRWRWFAVPSGIIVLSIKHSTVGSVDRRCRRGPRYHGWRDRPVQTPAPSR
jgi:hypothetical protein